MKYETSKCAIVPGGKGLLIRRYELRAIAESLLDMALGRKFPKCYLHREHTDRINRLADQYRDWCKLTNRISIAQGFEAFVLGQPSSYWTA